MQNDIRIRAYRMQNGGEFAKLTPKQNRRVLKKSRRYFYGTKTGAAVFTGAHVAVEIDDDVPPPAPVVQAVWAKVGAIKYYGEIVDGVFHYQVKKTGEQKTTTKYHVTD